jgi:hypothetical protein
MLLMYVLRMADIVIVAYDCRIVAYNDGDVT